MECVKGRPQPFGVEIRKDHINFAVQVPTGKKCELLLYKKGSMNPKYSFEMPEEKGDRRGTVFCFAGIRYGKI